MSILEVARKQLKTIGKLHHRKCGVCGEEIYFKLGSRSGVKLVACQKCRPRPNSNEVDLTWDELHLLLMDRRHESEAF